MTTSVKTFAFKTTGSDQPVNIRTIELDGEPWFVAVDVCRALGLLSDHTSRVAHLLTDVDVRTVTRALATSGVVSPDLFTSNAPKLRLLAESGLYKLIMRSDKKEALAFQDWVTREVLPAIRKTGGYLLNEAARETAHADTRTEMPLPAGFGELLKANLAMAELLAQAVRAQRS